MDRNGFYRSFLVLVLILSVGGLANCSFSILSGTGNSKVKVLRSDKSRVTSPVVKKADLAELVTGNNRFTFDLYQLLRKKNTNLFYSPYSISLALAMTYASAKGETEHQMSNALHFTLSQERLHPAFNALDLELASRGQGAVGENGRGFQLSVANSIWVQSGYSFLPRFLDVLAINYGARPRLLDFVNEPKASRLAINNWVSEQTKGRIQDLIPPSGITPDTALILTNGIYFKAAWHHPFGKGNTDDGLFHLLDGGQVTAPMMNQTEFFRYTEGNDYQAVELPYRGKNQWSVELSMMILLPEAGRFGEFESSLDTERVEAILSNLELRHVDLTMPKFTYESRFSLKETLKALGMPIAFTGAANFSGMDGTHSLFISDIIHKAFMSVDEVGTEASAATAVVVGLGKPLPPVGMRIDRPFIFMIRDIETGAILFVGRVLNPGV